MCVVRSSVEAIGGASATAEDSAEEFGRTDRSAAAALRVRDLIKTSELQCLEDPELLGD